MPVPEMITAVAGAVDTLGNLAAAPINNYYAKQTEKRQEEANIRAEQREQNYIISAEQRANAEYDRRMADQRQYDDPASMVARYRSAGLNPASINGNITSQPISQVQPHAPGSKQVQAQNTQFTPTELTSIMQSSANVKQTEANAKKLEAEAEAISNQEKRNAEMFPLEMELKKATKITEEQKGRLLQIQADVEEATKEDSIAYSSERLAKVKEDIEYVKELRAKVKEDTEVSKSTKAYYDNMCKKLEAEEAYLGALEELTKKQSYHQSELTAFSTGNHDYLIQNGLPGLWEASISLSNSQSWQVDQLGDYYEMQIKKLPEWKQKEYEVALKNAQANTGKAAWPYLKVLLGMVMYGVGVAGAGPSGGLTTPLIGVGGGMMLEAGLGTPK